ncbi:MAG: hypothetical protein HQM10_21135 [Candidatus Riflebacteria bacterium]|nr:hypothetical protein [Candidatus Riflebacteria bacterium]
MAKSKLSRLIEKFDEGDIDYDNLKEVKLDVLNEKCEDYKVMRIPKHLVKIVEDLIQLVEHSSKPKRANTA